MAYLLGIDLGTSSVKSVLMDETGNLKAIGQKEYDFDIPHEGWAEQAPDDWWKATVLSIKDALENSCVNPKEIAGIGFSGQMHGLVPLDSNHCPVRKAIIWCDQRSKEQVDEINEKVGKKNLGSIAHSPIATGFQTASLLWMKENEPDLYAKISKVVLPKDYIRFKLTGEIATDITDAASTLALDCNTGKWSLKILDILGLSHEIYPAIFRSDELAGKITKEAALKTGLAEGTSVVYGGADQVMQALGNGIIEPGIVSMTIGTGGQVLTPLRSSVYDSELRSHTFNFILPDTWYFMGAALSSGLSLKWLRSMADSDQTYADIDRKVEKVPVGSEGLVYLPYLSGERTPHMDAEARGMFFGLTLNHNCHHLMRSVMEGVVFSLRECLEILSNDMHQECKRIVASGGGSKSSVWLQMQADICNKEIYTSRMTEQAGVGAAIVAGIGVGLYKNYEEAFEKVVRWNDIPIVPIKKNVLIYDQYFEIYKQLYTRNKDLMKRCGELSLQEKVNCDIQS